MDRILVAQYNTQNGSVGVAIHEDTNSRGHVTYSYTGKWGAGSGHPREHMESELNMMLRSHPRHAVIASFWP